MRDIETIDGELRLLARAWSVAREFGVETSTIDIDELLDQRAAADTDGESGDPFPADCGHSVGSGMAGFNE